MILTINAWKPISLENACKFHIPPLKAAYQRTSVGPAIQRSSVPAQFSVPAPRRPFSVAAYQRASARWGKQRTSVPAWKAAYQRTSAGDWPAPFPTALKNPMFGNTRMFFGVFSVVLFPGCFHVVQNAARIK